MGAHQCHGIRISARRDAEFGVFNDPVEQDHLVGFLECMKILTECATVEDIKKTVVVSRV